MKKEFKFDVILDSEDLCDRVEEQRRLLQAIEAKRRLVIYSLRRMGKTSLVHVCSQQFSKKYPRAFILYVDLNELTSLHDVANRFRAHYEHALQQQFPLSKVKSYLSSLLSRLQVNLPGDIALSLEELTVAQPEKYLLSLFSELHTMSETSPLVLVLDEFQGTVLLRDVQAILRRELKALSKAAVILMGSNQRLLYKMFNDKKAPFFGFGEDMELKAIPLKDYLPYMNERFAAKQIAISAPIATYLMEEMNDIPNYINELGAWIVDRYNNIDLTKEHVEEAIASATRSKAGRYESALYGYTENQKKFIKAIAQLRKVKAYSGQTMIKAAGLTATELSRAAAQLEDAPLLSRDLNNCWYIHDPFLQKFLQLMG